MIFHFPDAKFTISVQCIYDGYLELILKKEARDKDRISLSRAAYIGLAHDAKRMLAVVNVYQNLLPIERPSQGTKSYLFAIGVTLIRHIKSLGVCRL
jgi:hypothetical protein